MTRAEPVQRPFGLPVKKGRDLIKTADWDAMREFISGRSWFFDTPCLEEDESDPLIAPTPSYGAFLLGFDFHLTAAGPRLIEINTNAGGFASVLHINRQYLPACDAGLEKSFVRALFEEYRSAGFAGTPKQIAIVDDDVANQPLYPEMLEFARLLQAAGARARVVCPEDLTETADGALAFQDGVRVDLVYSRLTDFRLHDAAHASLRRALLAKKIALTPHPGVYARVADKRNLLRLKHPLNPPVLLLGDKPIETWLKERKNWVFKPPESAGSKGVYRGDKISAAKLASLPPDTVAQAHVQAPRASDGAKFDVRVFTHGTRILGLAARHFEGQVMEMRSVLSGFQEALPEAACCFAAVEVGES